MSTKTFLVIGGAGLIGSGFIPYVISKYDDARVANVDKLSYASSIKNLVEVNNGPCNVFSQISSRDRKAIEVLFETWCPDYVVNFATKGHADRSIRTREAFAKVNIMGTMTMFNAVKAVWEQSDGTFGDYMYLQVFTDEVYGSPSIDEGDAFFREICLPIRVLLIRAQRSR